MTSRTQVAGYMAEHMTTDRRAAIRAAAAWLVDSGRPRQARYLARDVATILARRGYMFATVTTAREISGRALNEVERFIRDKTGAEQIEMVTKTDSAIIGGALIETPEDVLDGTVRTKLAKFVEGVSQ